MAKVVKQRDTLSTPVSKNMVNLVNNNSFSTFKMSINSVDMLWQPNGCR